MTDKSIRKMGLGVIQSKIKQLERQKTKLETELNVVERELCELGQVESELFEEMIANENVRLLNI